MALDPSIILQAGKGVTPLLNPTEIQDQQMQREVGGMKLAQLRQGMQDDQTMRNIAQNTAPEGLAGAYYKAGLIKPAQDAQKFLTDQQKAAADARKTRVDTGKTMQEAMGGPLKWLSENPSMENAAATLKHLNEAGIMEPAQVSSALQQLQADPTPDGIKKFAMLGYSAAISADKRMTDDTQRRGQDMIQQNSQATNATSAANNANTVGASRANNADTIAAADARANAKTTAPPKPLPAAALKMQQEGLDAIGTAKSINSDLDAIDTQITNGKLDFGPASNLYNKARNATGTSTEASRNFASFQANMEKLRNDSLRLNKGVQTDGDAQRAWNELFSNINDTKVVQQRLGEIKRLNERAVQLRKLDIDAVRQNYGHEPLDTAGYEKQPPALNGGSSSPKPAVKRTGTLNGRKVVEYADGSVDYAD